MKTFLNFCKENNAYMITERFSNKKLIVLNNKEVSLIEMFNTIFMDYVISHETCAIEIENTIVNDAEADELFIKIKTLLKEISNDINNYSNSKLTQI